MYALGFLFINHMNIELPQQNVSSCYYKSLTSQLFTGNNLFLCQHTSCIVFLDMWPMRWKKQKYPIENYLLSIKLGVQVLDLFHSEDNVAK